MYSDSDLLPISALQHLLFCERQCALIHLEQQWEENVLTAQGRLLHARADTPETRSLHGITVSRSVQLCSHLLGLVGVADTVEFHGATPFPVEYKRGRPKAHRADDVQLCAQALCLEEMLDRPVPEGALFYGKTRRRCNVTFDQGLRALTTDAAERLHRMIELGTTPPATPSRKCRQCSLRDLCLPELTRKSNRVGKYINAMLREKRHVQAEDTP